LTNRQVVYEYNKIKNTIVEDYIKIQKDIHKYFTFSFDGISATQYCGSISYNNQNIQILPKIAKNNDVNLQIFSYMLSYVYDLELKDIDTNKNNDKNTKNTLFEAIIQFFAKDLYQELSKGIYKEYISVVQNSMTLRGKYLVSNNIKHNFINEKIYCQYDDFSIDNQLNQFFLYAIKQLSQYTQNHKFLKQCEYILNNVTNIQIDINNFNIKFNRLNQRFKHIYHKAMVLLNHSIFTYNSKNDGYTFLFDMNELFEIFISKIVNDIDLSAKLQYKKSFGNMTLIPDIICQDIIIDTKYKIIKDKEDTKSKDMQQMFVYGINFKKKNVILLYPKHMQQQNYHLNAGIDDSIINIYVKTIDLDADALDYKDYIKLIEERINTILREFRDERN